MVENLEKRNETICTIHANYLKGNKQKQDRLQEYGFWLWNQFSAASNTFLGTYTLPTRDKYEGMFEGNKKCGAGSYYKVGL